MAVSVASPNTRKRFTLPPRSIWPDEDLKKRGCPDDGKVRPEAIEVPPQTPSFGVVGTAAAAFAHRLPIATQTAWRLTVLAQIQNAQMGGVGLSPKLNGAPLPRCEAGDHNIRNPVDAALWRLSPHRR